MDNKYMDIAIKEAQKAFKKGEVPVGAMIVKNGKIIAKAYNQKENYGLVTKHAEIIAIEKASRKLNNWRLDNCDLYVTLEPCPMCASALKQARINRVYCGLSNSYKDNNDIINKIFETDKTNKSVEFILIENENVKKLMNDFFKIKRKQIKLFPGK